MLKFNQDIHESGIGELENLNDSFKEIMLLQSTRALCAYSIVLSIVIQIRSQNITPATNCVELFHLFVRDFPMLHFETINILFILCSLLKIFRSSKVCPGLLPIRWQLTRKRKTKPKYPKCISTTSNTCNNKNCDAMFVYLVMRHHNFAHIHLCTYDFGSKTIWIFRSWWLKSLLNRGCVTCYPDFGLESILLTPWSPWHYGSLSRINEIIYYRMFGKYSHFPFIVI